MKIIAKTFFILFCVLTLNLVQSYAQPRIPPAAPPKPTISCSDDIFLPRVGVPQAEIDLWCMQQLKTKCKDAITLQGAHCNRAGTGVPYCMPDEQTENCQVKAQLNGKLGACKTVTEQDFQGNWRTYDRCVEYSKAVFPGTRY